MKYLISRKTGWTPEEIRNMDAKDVLETAALVGEEMQHEAQQARSVR